MIIYILGAFLLSLLCGGISTPLVLDFCKRKRLYDIPNERKVHKNATPRLGGITCFHHGTLVLACHCTRHTFHYRLECLVHDGTHHHVLHGDH